MRIEPVYLVYPPARAPQPPTRRAFLLAGAAFAGGTLVGGACGYTVGARLAAPVAEPEKLDVRLKELRRLAVDAPVEELVGKWGEWFSWFNFDYPDDVVLWRGLDRLAEWALENQTVADEPILTMLLEMSKIDKRQPESTLKRSRARLQAVKLTKTR
jgi:hypothetical protein